MKKTTFAFFCLFCAAVLFGQYSFYYGKNKIVRQAFAWKYVETKNFRIYHYIDDPELLGRVAREAEKAYEKLSSLLNVTIEEKTPIIFYNKQTDLEQTNLYPGIIPPGSFEGFNEPIGHRLVIYGNRSSEDLGRLITHELSHSFEYAILYKNRSSGMFNFNRPPLWVMEGFAEFMTDYWDSFSLMTVIDNVLSDRIPEIQDDGDIQTAFGTNRTPYDFGHLMYEFFYEKFGKKGVRDLLYSQRRPALVSKRKTFLEQFNFVPKTFNYEFKKYARNRFKTFIGRENPEDYSFIIGPDFPFAYSFSHQVSPGGELLAVVTVNYRTYKIEIILVSLKDGKVIKNVTPGYKSTYDGIEIKFVPSDGRSFSWDRRGENIAFFVRKELDSFLVVLNAIDNRVLKEFNIGAIQKPSSPVFHPSQDRLLFTGIEGIQSFLYSLDMGSGQIRKLSDGRTYIKAVDISGDGEKVVYSAGFGDFDKLYLAASESPDLAMRLTDGEYNDIAPAFSLDGKTVYYSSDELGAFNICSLDLENKIIYRHSDVRTGNFFPVEIPKDKGKLAISSFHKGSFLLFKKDVSSYLTKKAVEFTAIQSAAAPAAAAEEAAMPFTLSVKKYKPFEKLIITSLPPVTVGVDTNGGFFGSSYLNVTDMLGDHNFIFYLASFYGYRSYHLAYLNQRRRLQLYTHLFSESDAYYYPYVSNYYLSLRSRIGAEFALIYPFSRSTRAELTMSAYHQEEDSDLLFYQQELPYGQFFNGFALPVSATLVSETTRFSYYGPNQGHTFRLSVGKYFKLSSKSLDAYTLEGDFRKYVRLDNYSLLAFRLSGFYSGGKNSLLYWSGGNNTLRAADFRSLVGNKGFFFNAEFRFPLVHAALTPIGVVGPVRGVFFFDFGGLWFNDQEYRIFEPGKFQLKDSLSSYGYGIEFFLFGYPLHFEWVYRTDFKNKEYSGVNFWIGFDF
ncbi:MAG: BamA/TamA family outer membrane protein [Candidatus Aminicenantes bacterium]|nr:BamA/TamA family outer membrane protein [Candidatus Aminicenantes bacterium]